MAAKKTLAPIVLGRSAYFRKPSLIAVHKVMHRTYHTNGIWQGIVRLLKTNAYMRLLPTHCMQYRVTA
jgi:hypothetical protein